MTKDDEHPYGFLLHEMDLKAFQHTRAWLENAVQSQGAEVTACAVGMGQAELQIELDDQVYWLTIKPVPRSAVFPPPSEPHPIEPWQESSRRDCPPRWPRR